MYLQFKDSENITQLIIHFSLYLMLQLISNTDKDNAEREKEMQKNILTKEKGKKKNGLRKSLENM